jgi:hypothetical protein
LRASIVVAFALAPAGDPMKRRAIWVGMGAALGAGASVWARRRVELVAERMRTENAKTNVIAIVNRRAKRAAQRMRRAVAAGRDDARRREDELWQELEVRARAR